MFRSITENEFHNALNCVGQINAIVSLRARMLAEEKLRREIDLPSKFWKVFSHYHCILNPTYEIVNTLRFHTFLFTGNYIGEALQSYWRPIPNDILKEYKKLTVQLPDELIARPPRMLGEIGWEVKGGFVNKDILMYQKHIRALYLSGILDHLRTLPTIRILEIGSGYGALAYFLWTMLKPTSYFMIDLPESIAFSSVYLSLTTGVINDSIYLYVTNGD